MDNNFIYFLPCDEQQQQQQQQTGPEAHHDPEQGPPLKRFLCEPGKEIFLNRASSTGNESPELDNGLFRCIVMSRLHAKLTFSRLNAYIEDLGSSNGTWLERHGHHCGRVDKAVRLIEGDVLVFGRGIPEALSSAGPLGAPVSVRVHYVSTGSTPSTLTARPGKIGFESDMELSAQDEEEDKDDDDGDGDDIFSGGEDAEGETELELPQPPDCQPELPQVPAEDPPPPVSVCTELDDQYDGADAHDLQAPETASLQSPQPVRRAYIDEFEDFLAQRDQLGDDHACAGPATDNDSVWSSHHAQAPAAAPSSAHLEPSAPQASPSLESPDAEPTVSFKQNPSPFASSVDKVADAASAPAEDPKVDNLETSPSLGHSAAEAATEEFFKTQSAVPVASTIVAPTLCFDVYGADDSEGSDDVVGPAGSSLFSSVLMRVDWQERRTSSPAEQAPISPDSKKRSRDEMESESASQPAPNSTEAVSPASPKTAAVQAADEAILMSSPPPAPARKRQRLASKVIYGSLKAGVWMVAGSALTVAGLYHLGADDVQ